MTEKNSPVRWQAIVARYAMPDTWHSVWQILNSVVPFIAMWALMVVSLRVGFWLTLLLAFPSAGFMVRMFIIFHDCCHGSFFRDHRANEIVGSLLGLLVMTPFYQWKHDHAIHHATAGDLDRRGTGDVLTLTVKEYLTLPWYKKFGYRILRNPLILFTVGSFIDFVILQRFATPTAGKRERTSVVWTNVALAALVIILMRTVGWQAFLLVEIPILLIATSAGVWLFYVQHNFEGTYWARHDQWEFFKASVNGSSFYKLPGILNWFTGNIGYHHIHHLSPKIPNYKLPVAYRENPVFQIQPLTIPKSLKSLGYRLWDEEQKMLVGFNVLRNYRSKSL
ncbi:MAG: fatty acid desaturase [Chloroflexi bacterium]|nr:fatty acid desaturase [Chloroflexota bacterium]